MKTSRDNFNQATIEKLRARVGGKCSNPDHRVPTTGPTSDPLKINSIGEASHITAASPGGPRYDETLTRKQRSHIDNAIWLCSNCADLIDKDPDRYPIELLKKWKVTAERNADLELGVVQPSSREIDLYKTVLLGEPIKGPISEAVRSICNAAKLSMESLDPRFSVEVAYSAGVVSYALNAAEPVSISLSIATTRSPNVSEKFRALKEHGSKVDLNLEDITFEGSDIFKQLSLQKGVLSIESTQKKASLFVRFDDEETGESHLLREIVGTVYKGTKSGTFTGTCYDGMLKLELTQNFDERKSTIYFSVDVDSWHGKLLRSLPYLEEIYKFYDFINRGCRTSLAFEIEGVSMGEAECKINGPLPQISFFYEGIRYARDIRDLAKLLDMNIPYQSNFAISRAECQEIHKLWYMLVELPQKRGLSIGEMHASITF
jgi:hypothetical protein